MFEFDFLSLLYNANTLRNILMMLCTKVEQDKNDNSGGIDGGRAFLFFFFLKTFSSF